MIRTWFLASLCLISCAAPATPPAVRPATPPVDPSPLNGTLTYTAYDVSADRLICDVQVTFTGTPWTGTCVDCAWAFELAATVDAGANVPWCISRTDQTLVGRGGVPLVLEQGGTFEERRFDGVDWYEYVIQDALIAAYTKEYPVSLLLAPHPGSVVSWSETQIDWRYEKYGSPSFQSPSTTGDLCATLSTAYEPSAPVDGTPVQGVFSHPDLVDVWHVDAREGEDWAFEFAQSGRDQAMWILDSYGCWVAPEAWPIASCSIPDGGRCVGAAVHAGSTGPLQIMVRDYAQSTSTQPYSLSARGPDGPVAPTSDGVRANAQSAADFYEGVQESVVFSATLTP